MIYRFEKFLSHLNLLEVVIHSFMLFVVLFTIVLRIRLAFLSVSKEFVLLEQWYVLIVLGIGFFLGILSKKILPENLDVEGFRKGKAMPHIKVVFITFAEIFAATAVWIKNTQEVSGSMYNTGFSLAVLFILLALTGVTSTFGFKSAERHSFKTPY